MTEPTGEEPNSGRASRLDGARSAYLRSAAGQAIDWHPWGPAPFDLARRAGRPVLLDIGASWCHWCHVMDETTYADEEVARLLRQHFVAVKVDRDEHPEVDRRYQRMVSTLSGEGGWPLTAFLTPEGEVFLGGTFFPPTDGHGRPGFRRVLREVARLWRDERDRLADQAREVQEALRRMREAPHAADRPLPAFVAQVTAEVRASFDPANAGFGSAPKFPHPTAIALLLLAPDGAGDLGRSSPAGETLLRMADGGVYDQVGGGFHRYSVDAGWHVPHFEKMAIDNAALLGSYADGLRAFGEPRFEEVLRGTLGWAREVLADPAGGWGASQDADNAPGDDGSYFTWTRAELKEVLPPDEFRLVVRCFGIDTDATMPHDPSRNVLFRILPPGEAAEHLTVPGGPDAALARAVERLKVARAKRPTPTVDTAQYADLNGRFIAGFARAAAVLGEAGALADARRAADRWLRGAYAKDRGIAHQLTPSGGLGFGLLEDQVSFATGLVELAAETADAKYLTPAVDLLELVDREFRGTDGLLRDVSPRLYDGPSVGGISEPSYPLEDTPHLSANSGAALAFQRLGALLHDDRWTDRARALVNPMARRLSGTGLFAAGAALAAGLLETPPLTVVVEGTGPAAEALLGAARRAWHPNAFVFHGFPSPPFSPPFERPSVASKGEARAYACLGNVCAPPVNDATALSALIRSRRVPPAS